MSGTGGRRRLLVVEDSPTDVYLLKRALSENGVDYDMKVLDDGEKAIQYLDDISEDTKPHLIVIDINLPKLDGLEVLRCYRVSRSFTDSKFVILTSSDSPAEQVRAEMLGVDAFLRKPLLLDEYLAIGAELRRLLNWCPACQA